MERKLSQKQVEELKSLGVKFPDGITESIVRKTGVLKVIEDIRKLLPTEMGKQFDSWVLDLKKFNSQLVKKGIAICLWKGNRNNLEKYSRLLL